MEVKLLAVDAAHVEVVSQVPRTGRLGIQGEELKIASLDHEPRPGDGRTDESAGKHGLVVWLVHGGSSVEGLGAEEESRMLTERLGRPLGKLIRLLVITLQPAGIVNETGHDLGEAESGVVHPLGVANHGSGVKDALFLFSEVFVVVAPPLFTFFGVLRITQKVEETITFHINSQSFSLSVEVQSSLGQSRDGCKRVCS